MTFYDGKHTMEEPKNVGHVDDDSFEALNPLDLGPFTA
jgi:hypothetical protein